MKYTIGIDYGTKSGRAALVAVETGAVLAATVKEYSHGVISGRLCDGIELPANWCLQNPADYLEVLQLTVSEVIQKSGVSPTDVIGISIDFTSCTMLPVDGRGDPLCFSPLYEKRPHAYAKLWKHHAAQGAADRINEVLAEEGLLGTPRYGDKVSSELLLPKILQVLEEDEEIYNAADEFMEAMDWLCFKLTGEHRRSVSGASYKAMYLPGDGYPSEAVLEKINPKLTHLVKEKLQEDVCAIDEKFGELNQEWAEKWGLHKGIAVSAGIIDSHVGVAGCGITVPGDLMMILGTSSVLLALSDTAYCGAGIVGGIKGGIIPGYYAWESGLAAVGDQMEWFVDNCISASYITEAKEQNLSIHEYLTKKAADIPAGKTGLLILDWWSGNKTPYVDSQLTGVMMGLNMDTKPENIYRALIEATAFGTRRIVECYEQAGLTINKIIACGGIAQKNELFMQIYADIIKKDIFVSASGQTAALGAAMYAAVAAGSAAGGYDTIRQAAGKMSHLQKKVYTPQKENETGYEALYKKYKKASQFFGSEQKELITGLR